MSEANIEIERKFLIDANAIDYKSYPYREIEQGYLCKGPAVRVRRDNDDYYLTYKGKGELAHSEYNLPLTPESYEHLVAKADGIIIKKTRYLIPYGKYIIELDEFHESLAPLLLAEVEFESVEEANSFEAPSWFVKDVTGDPKYSNSYLTGAY